MKTPLHIGLVHDWLVSMRGGEKAFEVICEIFPDADVGTLVHRPGSVSSVIERHHIKTSFLQNLPFALERYQYYLPLFPSAIEGLDFSGYDCVISSSHAAAKGVRTGKSTLHICYCHTPMRYIWDQYDSYINRERSSFFIRAGMKISLPYLREWDIRSSKQVTHFLTNSCNVQERIRRLYGRDSEVMYGPVDTRRFSCEPRDDGYFLIISALVPNKCIDVAVEAFNLLGYRLIIAGSGIQVSALKAKARKNIEFLGWVADEKIPELYANCRAVIFPGEEDFGLVPIEAMAAGKPVIAYGAGGVLETVVDGETGIFFREQNPQTLCDAVRRLPNFTFDPELIRKHAAQFDRSIFRERMERFISKKLEDW